ncbi:hypothetical protein FGG08_002054 [Glutinoglossum americanum]|uniref:Amino acid transporter transmembrane domain-containing protein n=1 Tax=Glutinoglossum americanum TaxID=1670608 RepID=A0A9P8KZI7_9PEZI|nr:hypothetical protein FGG08_002054 [Glutinoglossum americanum]
MSVIHCISTDNRDLEYGPSRPNQAHEGSSGEDLSLESSTKGNANKEEVSDEALNPADAERGRKGSRAPEREEPFGDEEHSDVKYRTMAWWWVSFGRLRTDEPRIDYIMIAETISLGILSLPSALATIGLVPGIILIIGLGMAATYTGYVIGQFKACYPHVHNMADAGEVLLGATGREIFGIAQITFLIFIMASHVLTFAIMLNVLSNHGACTIIFAVAGMVISILFTLPRTLKNISYFSVASFISISAAVLITMFGVAIWKPGDGAVKATNNTSLYKGFLAVTNIVFAYAAGHVAFFSFISEMKTPSDYPKALVTLQFADTTLYVIAAVVIYRLSFPGSLMVILPL